MADHSATFLLITILALITIILVSGMKYFATGRVARLQAARDGDLAADLNDIKQRLAAIEKILKEVE